MDQFQTRIHISLKPNMEADRLNGIDFVLLFSSSKPHLWNNFGGQFSQYQAISICFMKLTFLRPVNPSVQCHFLHDKYRKVVNIIHPSPGFRSTRSDVHPYSDRDKLLTSTEHLNSIDSVTPPASQHRLLSSKVQHAIRNSSHSERRTWIKIIRTAMSY